MMPRRDNSRNFEGHKTAESDGGCGRIGKNLSIQSNEDGRDSSHASGDG